jgi:hypothetical protein
MDLYNILNNNLDLLDEFCEILESSITKKVGYKPLVHYTRTESCLYFFFENSSILQIMPDKEYQYTFANVPQFQSEINDTIKSISKKVNRNIKIDIILSEKKESD